MDKIYLGNINGPEFHDGYAGAVFDAKGISPTLNSMSGGNRQPMTIVHTMREKKIGNLNGFDGGNFAGNVYDKNHCSPALNTMGGGNRQPIVIDEVKAVGHLENGTGKHQSNTVYDSKHVSPALTTITGGTQQIRTIVAMRGRNPENPSDRTAGIQTEQRLEMKDDGTTNALTSVQKDNLLLEQRKIPIVIGKDGAEATEEEILELAQTLKSEQYRIRKLTPRSCGRLMGVSDSNISKMLAVNSNTQCYKEFGNSIVVTVLMSLLSQLNIDGVTPWNDLSDEEINKLIENNL